MKVYSSKRTAHSDSTHHDDDRAESKSGKEAMATASSSRSQVVSFSFSL